MLENVGLEPLNFDNNIELSNASKNFPRFSYFSGSFSFSAFLLELLRFEGEDDDESKKSLLLADEATGSSDLRRDPAA
jgi:hypothetical protein